MTNSIPAAASLNDADLVEKCLANGADAFSEIVARYQSMVCALTYNATGSLSRSEDLAQEVFLTAWKELRQLREPSKLRSWLYGIARRLTAKARHREGRDPVCVAEELVEEHHTQTPSPSEQTISREEEAILWRSLEEVPHTYREPLILFYREGQSLENVAATLDLTEDAARQRLSRGRKMLEQQVALFVENTLRQTTPGRAFTLAVIFSLPAVTKSAAVTIGTTAAKSATATKSLTLLGVLGLLIGPLAGCFTAWHAVRASLEDARSERERQFLRRQAPITLALLLLLIVGVFEVEARTDSIWDSHPVSAMLLRVLWSICLPTAIFVASLWGERRLVQIRADEATHLDPVDAMRQKLAWRTFEYKSSWTLLGLPLIHVLSGRRLGEKRRPAIGWIAIGDIAIGVLFSAGGFALGGITLGVLSCGILPIGVLSVGVLAFGGLSSIGLWGAMGATSVGYFAHGGNALAWHAAEGARAVAHDFAKGLHAYALHANDPAASEAIATLGFFRLSHFLARHAVSRQVVWLPTLLYLWQLRRARGALKTKLQQ